MIWLNQDLGPTPRGCLENHTLSNCTIFRDLSLGGPCVRPMYFDVPFSITNLYIPIFSYQKREKKTLYPILFFF